MKFWRIWFAAVLLAACSTSGGYDKMPVTVADPAQAGAQGPDKDLKDRAQPLVQALDTSLADTNIVDPFNTRIAQLLIPHRMEDGLNLNFKVYDTNDVTALAFPDGSIRLSYGLLNLLDDNELLFVVGREIGHVKLDHTKRKFKDVYVGASEPVDHSLLAQRYIAAPYTEEEQREADLYGLNFLRKHGYQAQAALRALTKLAASPGQAQFGAGSESLGKRIRLIENDVERMNAWDGSRGRIKPSGPAPVKNAPVRREFRDSDLPPRVKSA